ncbi:MAG: universal stress protein [Myxococcales bacterium]|nr:universal stress protein [Myxococcales bacterium]
MTEGNGDKNRIVVAVDMTETGDHALREGMRLAKVLPDSELHVAYVIKADKDLHDAKKLDKLSDDMRTAMQKIQEHVASVCAPPSGEDPFTQETIVHIRLGQPATGIHQVAVDVDADMVVVGTHGRRGVEKLILGSVAEELIRIAQLPVTVAHPKNLANLEKSAKAEPRRPGEDLHSTGLSNRLHLEFRPRTSHISGLV